MPEINRREFVVAAACAAGACLMCGMGEAMAADAPADAKVDVGTAAEYAKDGAYDKLADTKKIIVVRDNGKLYALSAICTHRLGIVKLKGTELVCPKHNSHFGNDGTAKSGPAKAALFRLGISTNGDGHIIVDTGTKFGEKEWTQAGASIDAK